ncbi:MAG TPA: hypothetical protein VF765_29030 [Polyangiaceae bacterium]
MRLIGLTIAALALCVSLTSTACRSCREDESEEQEERDLARDHFWRAQITIVGQGTVKTHVDAFDCTSDGKAQHGTCGPRLVVFKELAPPMMEAIAAPGWRFDHWDALIREPDGGTHGRVGPMPDGKMYLDGFGYRDTGQLETVTAVFVPDADAQLGVHP